MAEGFYLGRAIDSATGDTTEDKVAYDPSDLTTHGVIVGMTGSGKTGLGVIYLEEALLAGIPTLILDPKGDMTNLLLTFPDLLPSDFKPWIDPALANEDQTIDEAAEATAELWRSGLGKWDQDGERIRALREAADFKIYTPGSQAGLPVNIVGSLNAPDLDWDSEAETLRAEIQGFVSGLLGLVGIDADPISSREHILLSNLIEHNWRAGHNLDLAGLLGQVHQPPMRKLGVFELDTFFPEKDRMGLAMKLNGLVASPSFATWMEGPPLDIGSMLFGTDGKPQASILYLAHLSEEERQFIVTLIMSKVVTWMRSQSGTGELRALVYMDEVYGFVPPTAEPPAKKPILTMLKQARAFGVGLLLSTQNPVDLDYKAMSNAGTWCVGRLQTERDKARIVEALKSATGTADISKLDASISGLDKRQFLLHSTRETEPTIFATRWAMSYLRGPLTREQIGSLMDGVSAPAPPPAAAAAAPAATPAAPTAAAPASTAPADVTASGQPVGSVAEDESPVMPKVADGIPVYHMDAAAPWASTVGADPTSRRHAAALAVRVKMIYDDTPAKLTHQQEWEAIFMPLEQPFDADNHTDVDYDDRDFRPESPPGALYVLTDAKINTKTYFTSAATAIKNSLYLNSKIEIFKNADLKLYSRVGETREDFFTRCDTEAQDRADAEVAKLRDRYETKLKRLDDQLQTAERRHDELAVDVQGSRQSELLEGAGTLLGMLTGRKSSRSLSGSARRRSATRSKEQRLRSAQDKISDKQQQIQDLEDELIIEIDDINGKWEDLAGSIEPVEVGLEKNDITIAETALVWIPVPR